MSKKDFGEFKSVEELNMAAEGLKEEGDLESLKKLAKENGIDEDDAIDYFEGAFEELANASMAAIGKIDLERAELKLGEILDDWANYIKAEATESEEVAAGVMRHSLADCIAELLKYSYKHANPVPDAIMKAAGIGRQCSLGMPGAGTAKKIIREFYLG